MTEPKPKAGRNPIDQDEIKVQLCLYVKRSTMAIIGESKSEKVNMGKTREYLYHQLKVFEK